MILLLVVGQTLDVLTFAGFMAILPAGALPILLAVERNPIIVTLFSAGGLAAVIVVKVSLVILILWLDGRRLRPRSIPLRLFFVIAGVSGFIGALSNTMAISEVMEVMGT